MISFHSTFSLYFCLYLPFYIQVCLIVLTGTNFKRLYFELDKETDVSKIFAQKLSKSRIF